VNGVPKKLTYEEVKEAFDQRGYRLISEEYRNSREKLKYVCPEHPDKINEIQYQNFKQGQGCFYCYGTKKYTLEEVRNEFLKAGYALQEIDYKNNSTKMRYTCPSHPDKDTSITLKDLMRGVRCSYCYRDNSKGENHPSYNPDLSDEERAYKRNDIEYYDWRRKVFERDSYTCTTCGDNKGGNLVAHHKDGYGWCRERRTDIDNGVTLCKQCHKDFHILYRIKNNTESQYNEWVKERRG
jgi:hypothetical protein